MLNTKKKGKAAITAYAGEYADAIVIYLKRRARQLEYDDLGIEQRREATEIKRCFAIERRKLDEYLGEGRISEEEADEIRVQINALETSPYATCSPIPSRGDPRARTAGKTAAPSDHPGAAPYNALRAN
jgi:hypothetical protein